MTTIEYITNNKHQLNKKFQSYYHLDINPCFFFFFLLFFPEPCPKP
jgi:hypothetical protein